jgi:calcineurin-like phosphoesterase family protein
MIFFTSDTHFGHANIVKYCQRPFESIEEHDQILIGNWNRTVGKNDTVYHLGDFCFKNKTNDFESYLKKLNGFIYLIWGNHDQVAKYEKMAKGMHVFNQDKIRFLGDYERIKIEGQDIILSHYSFRVWDKSHHGSWNLYGHSHGTLFDDPHLRSIDVGVDSHNYYPISFDQVKRLMNNKYWRPIDHHGNRQEGGGIGLNREDYAKKERRRLFEQLKQEFEKS